MTQKKYETVVGIFVVATLLVLLAMVVIVAQQQRLWEERVEYRAIFQNVGGLKVGSEVRLSGVTVGTVQKVFFDPEGNIIVQIEVLSEYQERIRQNSKATIGSIGLLGDMSFNITSGSAQVAAIPPGGTIPSTEPIDLSTLLEKATPALDDFQKILANLSKITSAWADKEGDLNMAIRQLSDITVKINKGKGSLGMLVNDPQLYKELSQAISGTEAVIASLNTREGLMATLLHDTKFKDEAQKSMTALKATLENSRQASDRFRKLADRLPTIIKKGEGFLDNLSRASANLPELVTSGQGLIDDADQVAQAAQKSWLLRRYIPKKKEKTILMEQEIQGGGKP